MDTIYSDFAYDDAYRTMESECDDLLIPFVNYFHNENYGSSSKIIRMRNEHFIEKEGHAQEKRITDSAFEIIDDNIRRMYHYECESGRYSNELLVRMFEYDTQIGKDLSTLGEHCLHVNIPYSGLLLLRDKGDFRKAYIELTTPGGDVRYPVEIRRMSELDIDDIFDKHLYMLLPFYIFNVENRLDEINRDDQQLEKFADLYRDIVEKLENSVKNGCLSSFSYGVIIRLIHKVAYKMTIKRDRVQKKVGDIMGGRVLDLDIVKARREGLNEGRNEERADNIRKLAEDYMARDASLSREKAIEMAENILS